MWLGEYVTQVGPDGNGHDRCWAACIASALLSFGWDSDPYGLMREVAAHGPGEGHPADVDEVAKVAHDFGVSVDQWVTWQDAETALARGHVVLALLANHLLIPRAYPVGPQWEALHWVRLVQQLDGNQLVYCYDPLCYIPQYLGGIYQGPTLYTRESLTNAIMATPFVDAGLILGAPNAAPDAPQAPTGGDHGQT